MLGRCLWIAWWNAWGCMWSCVGAWEGVVILHVGEGVRDGACDGAWGARGDVIVLGLLHVRVLEEVHGQVFVGMLGRGAWEVAYGGDLEVAWKDAWEGAWEGVRLEGCSGGHSSLVFGCACPCTDDVTISLLCGDDGAGRMETCQNGPTP